MTGCTRILIVDDEQDIVEVLEKILEDEAKYEVEVAQGGFAAGVNRREVPPPRDPARPAPLRHRRQGGRQAGQEQPRPAAHQGDRDERQDASTRRPRASSPRASTASSRSPSTSSRSSRPSRTRWRWCTNADLRTSVRRQKKETGRLREVARATRSHWIGRTFSKVETPALARPVDYFSDARASGRI